MVSQNFERCSEIQTISLDTDTLEPIEGKVTYQ